MDPANDEDDDNDDDDDDDDDDIDIGIDLYLISILRFHCHAINTAQKNTFETVQWKKPRK